MTKIILIAGNRGSTTFNNWTLSVTSELERTDLKVITADFPDPELARDSSWIPFLFGFALHCHHLVLKTSENL